MWVGKTYKIEAAHYLTDHEKWSDMHGHTYHICVMVEGRLQDNGFVIHPDDLDDKVKEVLKPLDHEIINFTIAKPTCENIANYICKELAYALPRSIREVKIRVQEGDERWAESHNMS